MGNDNRELVARFRSTTLDRLERLTLALLDLERDPDDTERRAELLREIHTLKGEARMMGFADINLVAHRIEDLMRWASDHNFRVPTALNDILLTGFDVIGLLVQKRPGDERTVDLGQFLASIDRFFAEHGGDPLGNPPEAASAEAAEAVTAAATDVAPADAPANPDAVSLSDDPAASGDTGMGQVLPPTPEPVEPSELSERTISATADTAIMDSGEYGPPAFSTESGHVIPDDGYHATGTTVHLKRPATRMQRTTGRTDEDSIRIDLDKLDHLLTLAGDLLLSHERTSQGTQVIAQIRDDCRVLARSLGSLSRELPRLIESGSGGIPRGVRQYPGDRAVSPDRIIDQTRELADLGRSLLAVVERQLRELREDTFRNRNQLETLEINVRELRLLPVGTLFRRYPRSVRDISREQGKQVAVTLEGEAVELDKRILDQIAEPLLHLIRNSIDHGLETPSDRERAGKPPEGTMRLTARQAGALVEIEVADDGRGIVPEAVAAAAVERGVLTEAQAAALPPSGMIELIFEPGFSTRREVSQLSGRGVGLDVVRDTLETLGGTVHVVSHPGRGTRFIMQMPVRVAISKAQIVRLGNDRYAIPAEEIEKLVTVRVPDLEPVGNGRAIRYTTVSTRGASREELVPVDDLARVLRVPVGGLDEELYVAVINHGGRRQALRIDEFLGEQEIVHRPFDRFLAGVTVFSGTTILPDGGVAPILNVLELLRSAAEAQRPRQPADTAEDKPAARPGKRQPEVLLVEDSEITRELLVEILRLKGYRVTEAANGAAGLEALRAQVPDLIVTDIDMPEMDGFRMLEQLRAQPEYYNVPVVVLTTRGAEEDKRRALDLGANAYLVKTDFQEDNLVSTVERLLGQDR